MHEAGAVGRALDTALREAPPGASAPRAASLVVSDPAHIAPQAPGLHLQVHLAEHGLAHLPVHTTVRPATCPPAGRVSEPAPSAPF